MRFNADVHHRQSIRLREYDYATPGAYFVTIVTHGREYHFGDVHDGHVMLSDIGQTADRYWRDIPLHFPHIAVDAVVVMPNHIHGILFVMSRVGVENFQPLRENTHRYQHITPKSIGSIIRGFKIGVTSWCRNNDHSYFGWQRNYHERIIRAESELNRIRQYVADNPGNWETDDERPR